MVQFLIMIVFMEILVIISMIIVIIVLLEKFEYFWFSLFLRIVIWSPAGQRHNVTMMEMNPSLHPVWEELVQIRGVNVRYGIFFIVIPKITQMLAQATLFINANGAWFFFFTPVKSKDKLI